MNHLLLTIGIAIILAAIAAISAPFLIDWSTQRDFFEAHAARILGQPVKIDGDIDARLLPEPSFRFSDVTVGEADADGAGVITFGAIAVRLAPGSLLKSQAEITRAEIEEPVFQVEVAADGSLVVPGALRGGNFDPSRVSAETVSIVRGRMTLIDAASRREWTLSEITGDAAVRSLDGPYRFDGGFVLGGAKYDSRLATGKAAAGKLPLLLVANAVQRPLAIEIDGAAVFDGPRPVYDGDVAVRHGFVADDGTAIGPIWSADATLQADPEGLSVSEGTLVFGPADREVRLTGTANLPFRGTETASMALSGRQVDLDRYLGAGPEEPTSPAAVLAAILDLIGGVAGAHPAGDIDVTLDTGAAIIAGEIVQEVEVAARIGTGSVAIERLQAVLPGNASVDVSGALTGTADAPRFDGKASVDALNVVPALRWLTGGELAMLRDAERAIAGLSLEADLKVRPESVEIPRFSGKLREAPLSGALSIRQPEGDGLGAIRFEIDADVLDLPDVDFARIVGGFPRGETVAPSGWYWLDRYKVDLALDVDRLFVGDGGASGVVANLSVADGAVEIRDLAIAELLGSSLTASGSVFGWPDAPEGRLSVDVSATELAAITPLLQDLGIEQPDDAEGRFDVASFQPATAKVEISAGLIDGNARLSFTGNGTLGGSDIRLDGVYEAVTEDEAGPLINVDLTASNPSSLKLLRQAGLSPLGIAGPERRDKAGSLAILVQGVPAEALQTTVDADVMGVTISASGLTKPGKGELLDVDYDADIEFADADAVLDFLGLPPTATPQSGTLRARVLGDPLAPRFQDILGVIEGSAVRGALAVGRTGDRPKLSGRLRLDRADAAWLIGTAFRSGLGVIEPGDAVGQWPTDPIGASAFAAVDLDLRLRADRFTAGRLDLDDARMRLRNRDGTLLISGLQGRGLGGKMTGTLTLKPGPAGMSLSGGAQLDGADLAAVSRLVAGDTVGSGRIDLNVQADGQGRSVQTLVASLTGGGRYSIGAARIDGLGPAAFARVASVADSGATLTDADVEKLFAEGLADGALEVASADGVISIDGGVLRVSNAILAGEKANVRATGAIDLADLSVDAALTVAAAGDYPAVDPQTEATVSMKGPVAAPRLAFDVAALTGHLSVRQFEREVERIETLQADILERQRLSRELTLHRQLLQRRVEPAVDPEEATAVEPESQPARIAPDPVAPPAEAVAVEEAPAPPPRQQVAEPDSGNADSFGSRIRSVLEDNSGILAPLPPATEIGPAPGGG